MHLLDNGVEVSVARMNKVMKMIRELHWYDSELLKEFYLCCHHGWSLRDIDPVNARVLYYLGLSWLDYRIPKDIRNIVDMAVRLDGDEVRIFDPVSRIEDTRCSLTDVQLYTVVREMFDIYSGIAKKAKIGCLDSPHLTQYWLARMTQRGIVLLFNTKDVHSVSLLTPWGTVFLERYDCPDEVSQRLFAQLGTEHLIIPAEWPIHQPQYSVLRVGKWRLPRPIIRSHEDAESLHSLPRMSWNRLTDLYEVKMN